MASRIDTWPQALLKQTSLFQAEANNPDHYGEPDRDFAPGAHACRRAIVLWKEVSRSYAKERSELLARLRQMDDEIRIKVGKRLQEEGGERGWMNVADTLIDPKGVSPQQWLEW